MVSRCCCNECTPDFPDWALLKPMQWFSSKAWRLETFRLCPTMLGIPSKRMRRFSVLWDSSKVDFAGTFSEFVNLFVQPTEVPGSIFFRKGEDLGLEASKTKLQSLQMYTDIWRNYGQEPGRFIEVLVRSEPAASFRKARDGRADLGDASQPLLLGEEKIVDGR